MTPADLAAWNQEHPVGTAVVLTKDDGTEIVTQTRSEAWLVSGDHPVVLVNKYTGGFSLNRIRKVKNANK